MYRLLNYSLSSGPMGVELGVKTGSCEKVDERESETRQVHVKTIAPNPRRDGCGESHVRH